MCMRYDQFTPIADRQEPKIMVMTSTTTMMMMTVVVVVLVAAF